MKILIFSTAYFPFVGGAEVAVKEITKRLGGLEFSAQGGPAYSWDMITARMDKKLPKQERMGNINVYRIGIGIPKIDKYLLAFFGHRLAQKLHKKNNYNATWSMMASYNGFSALFFKKKNPEVPFLLTLQEGDEIGYILKRSRVLKKQFRDIFRKADFVQCISNYLADWARDMGAKGPIEVIPNGVDISKFSKTFSVQRDKKLIMAGCSRLEKKNAVDAVIKSLKYLSDVKILVMGDGKDREELENLAKEVNAKDRVIFFGKYNNDDLPKKLSEVSIFVRPSLSEGQGIAFLEAMAASVPVIATPVGGIPDFLSDRVTGWFCKVKDPESIAKKIKYLLDEKNKTEVEKVVGNAKKMIEEKYDWENISVEMNKLFKKL